MAGTVLRCLLSLIAAVVLLLLSPIIIPIAEWLHARVRRRMRAMAQNTPCERCGMTLGPASLDRADQEWAEHIAARRRENPGLRMRLHRRIRAICTACDARYGYDADLGAFDRLDDQGSQP
jgi:hypothetical protein